MKSGLISLFLLLLFCFNSHGTEMGIITEAKHKTERFFGIKNYSRPWVSGASSIYTDKDEETESGDSEKDKAGDKEANGDEKKENPIVELIDQEVGRYFRTLGLFIQLRPELKSESEKSKSRARTYTYKEQAKNEPKRKERKSPGDTSTTALRKGKEIIGFHPYWMGKTYENYDFDLLTAIAYFSYELNPETGNYLGYERMNDWRTTQLIELAQNQGCKVFLTVTNFEADGHQIFLNNKQAQYNSIRIISDLLTEPRANGVIINFEAIPKELGNKFTSYIKDLSTVLNKIDKSVMITLPPIPDRVFNTAALKDHVDNFIVMGKNYYVKSSEFAGPVAPLKSGSVWKNGSLESTISNYLQSGIPEEKIILSLPYYGSKWKTEDGSVPSRKIEFNEFLKYQTIKQQYPLKPSYDSISETAYLNVYEDGDHFQIWFDDAKTLSKKFEFIIDQDLAGVGIWALGYGDGYADLREALKATFAVSDVESDIAVAGRKLPEWLVGLRNFHVLMALLYFLMIIFSLGLLLSLRNFEVREIVFRRRWIKYVVIIGVPALLLFTIFTRSYPEYAIVVFLGLLLGYLIYFFVNRSEDLDNNVNRVV